ncbi:transcriptional regulator [Listeria seeligeri]|uniref:transcriptional regulator n=1 Tax=Listeria seeligeri TaxID=1640 RepID=UPI001626003B|nr:transcriptional regulator [Listeria seeligeri]MBC2071747.1 transcriptional regulator [Listeria seeligeri]
MAGFIKKYLDGKDWTIYQLGNATGLAHQTIRMADKKTVDQISAKNVRLIAEVFGFTAGEMLDEFYEIEEKINNDAIVKELITVFEKYGYNTDEISLELLDGETIKLDMADNFITILAEAVNETEHFTAYLDDSTDYMIVEKKQGAGSNES